MYQGTTPSLIFEIKGYDLTTANVFVSLQHKDGILTKSGSDIAKSYDSGTTISTVVCSLTQEETLAMRRGSVTAQIRFVYENGLAYATDKSVITVNDVIYKEVISYDGGDTE